MQVDYNGDKIMTDEEILYWYSQWSEDYYCASFLTPDSLSVQEFRNWLYHPDEITRRSIQYDYEREMLKEFHKQEKDENG